MNQEELRVYKRNWARKKRGGGAFVPRASQFPGQEHTFFCGCAGILPFEKGTSNEFAIWTCVGKIHVPSHIWICRKCECLRNRRKRIKLKLEVFSYYCKGTPYCQCLGCRNGKENPVHINALQIDHLCGNGSKHKQKNGQREGGNSLYRLLRSQNYPEGYQVLCANCNGPASKGVKLQCPFHGQSH